MLNQHTHTDSKGRTCVCMDVDNTHTCLVLLNYVFVIIKLLFKDATHRQTQNNQAQI